VLSRLAKSKYVDESVFKGGTSLSKGYNLIERFSEDVDIAIINDKDKSGNEIKTIIRAIEKEITPDLTELQMDGVTSKGSRFRKSVFEYISTEKGNQNNKLIVEVNSFANPFPFQKLKIQSFIFDFLMQTGNEKYIEQFHLQPIDVNVLSKKQTLLEKMVSLIRFSFEENSVESISKKIRHFYDLYFLMNNSECAQFVASDSFKKQFDSILQHDRDMFEEPKDWQNKLITESPLVNDFTTLWNQLKVKYQTELSALAYRPIPNEKDVAICFEKLIMRIK
nr:nucleotidyl transferase AbiEii/AbiGii toxin family protein [Pseudomonadota bacterium]